MKKHCLLAAVLLFSTAGFAQQTKNFIDQPYIEVNGSADTLVTPNEIYIRIILSERDSRDRVSIEELEQKMSAAVKGTGIDIEKDLTLADITSNFKIYLLKSKDIIKTKVYVLKVKDALIASQVFIKLEEAGISNAGVERVDYSDMGNLKNIMRTKAISDAKASAIALTKPLNQSVGAAIYISDTENVNSQSQPRILLRGLATIKNEGYDYALPKVEFEKIKVSANINAKFVLR